MQICMFHLYWVTIFVGEDVTKDAGLDTFPASDGRDLGRYSTFQYPDQDAYQYAYAEDFNADTLFHVSVSVKRIVSKFNTFYQKCGDK